MYNIRSMFEIWQKFRFCKYLLEIRSFRPLKNMVHLLEQLYIILSNLTDYCNWTKIYITIKYMTFGIMCIVYDLYNEVINWLLVLRILRLSEMLSSRYKFYNVKKYDVFSLPLLVYTVVNILAYNKLTAKHIK